MFVNAMEQVISIREGTKSKQSFGGRSTMRQHQTPSMADNSTSL
jgi:hypothetical protein